VATPSSTESAAGAGHEAATEEDEAFRILSEWVALAPTNLEDPVRGRYEKPNYSRTAQRIASQARAWGLEARIFDPVPRGWADAELRGIPRPNVVVDLAGSPNPGRVDRVLLLSHYDVVPVPAEQIPRWRSPPHELTKRSDGRWYGRGSNDDLGSGVVASLLAMRRLRREGSPCDVRLLACCDEETGGTGGIEALKAHDARLPTGDPDRFLDADVCLIPDGSPYVAAASSGVLFLDGSFEGSATLSDAIAYARILIGLHSRASAWKSRYASPEWKDGIAPEPVITGRATLTRLDFEAGALGRADAIRLRAVHAETDSTNLIPESVTLAFDAPGERSRELLAALAANLPEGIRIETDATTSLRLTPGTWTVAIVGKGHHAGLPHRARNPVPVAVERLASLADRRLLDPGARGTWTFGVDLRLTPEMTVAQGRDAAFDFVLSRTRASLPQSRLDAPPPRQRGGYALDPSHPAVVRLSRILGRTMGNAGVFGEYGGTDASSLVDVPARAGGSLAAPVFGSMDPEARIHEAEESVDPRLLAAVVDSIVEFVRGA
jgi:acetylornithine deacetylase/succinyl-diaminopimelate desuccinylase-like protein